MDRKMGRKPHIYKSEGYWCVFDGWAARWNDLAREWCDRKNEQIVVHITNQLLPDLFNGPTGEYIAPRPFWDKS